MYALASHMRQAVSGTNIKHLLHLTSFQSSVRTMAAERRPALHEYDGAGDYSPDNYNFHIGAPHPSELLECSRIVQSAMQSLAKEPADFRTSAFQYGRELGAEPALAALARFLTEEYQRPVKQENLMITSGASMAFSLVCMEFFTKYPSGEQPVVFVEHPTYFLVMDIALGHGFRVEPIPTDANGSIDFVAWEVVAAAIKSPLQKPSDPKETRYKALVYLVPAFRNPTGESLNEATAKKVHDFCVAQNMLVHCDDVYNILYYGEKPPTKLFPVGESAHVISGGTFSKLLGPGLRVGWIEASTELVTKLATNGLVVSGGCVAQFASFLIERAISSGDMTKHVRDLRLKYTEKVQTITQCLETGLPADVKWHHPEGGYFIWIVLGEGSSDFITRTLVPEAKKLNIRFGLGAKSCPQRGQTSCALRCRDAIRLSIGHVTVEQIPEGIAKLCELLHRNGQSIKHQLNLRGATCLRQE